MNNKTFTEKIKTFSVTGTILGSVGVLVAPSFLWMAKALFVVVVCGLLFYLACQEG